MAFTCSSNDATSACPTPGPGSDEDQFLTDARSRATFQVLFPCKLPGAERLIGSAVNGAPPRQRVELIFNGPFDMIVRQSQFPPAVNPDPTGASRVDIDLFPNVRATLIERYDGSRHTEYQLYWERNALFYEVQAEGPPLQRDAILTLARSLE